MDLKKCEKHFENAFEKMRKNAFQKCEKTCEKMNLKTQLGKLHPEIFFYQSLIFIIFSLVRDLLQSLQSFFVACQISAGWKSERSS